MSDTKIIITMEAMDAIRSAATFEFPAEGTRRPDGRWEVPLNEQTMERLNKLAFEGETASDTIIRLVSLYHRKPS